MDLLQNELILLLQLVILEGDKPVFTYTKNEKEITESEYNADIQNYEVVLTTKLNWIQIQ